MPVDRREWGYALRGHEPLSVEGYSGKRERTSSVATFDVEGFVSWYISAGTFNQDRFIDAIETIVVQRTARARLASPAPVSPQYCAHLHHLPPSVLPQLPNMNPYPGTRSVLILDNARIHHTPRLVNLMATAGCLLLNTPPYCFTLTPLDNSAFGGVKSYLQERQLEGTMQEKMDEAFTNAVSRKQARHYYRKCGYGAIM